jgi:hypothetical protein
MIQSRTPFLEALIVQILRYWTDQNVWATPRETAIVRWVERRLRTLHGRQKIRNALLELVRLGVLARKDHGRYEVSYSLKPHYMWPGAANYREPYRTVLLDPRIYVARTGSCWIYGRPTFRGGARIYRAPVYPHHIQEFLFWRANHHCLGAKLDPENREVHMTVKRAIADAALTTARFFYGATSPTSPAKRELEGLSRLTPVLEPNPDLLLWRRKHRGRQARWWRPEDNPWAYWDEIETVLGRLCGVLEPPGQRAPFGPTEVFAELDKQLKKRLTEILRASPIAGAGLSAAQQLDITPRWVEQVCGDRGSPSLNGTSFASFKAPGRRKQPSPLTG